MLKHCKEFKEFDIWYLCNTDKFQDRKLFLGKCPICLKDVAKLVETRISDGVKYTNKAVGYKSVMKLCDKVRHHVITTAQEISIKKGKPYGLCFGDNKEIHNNKGQIIAIKQKRCDWYGQNETIKEIKVF